MSRKKRDQPEVNTEPKAKQITPADIQQKEFRLALRGYNERDVDVFLDEVTEELARLYAETKRLREDLELRETVRGDTQAAVVADALVRQARDEAARILAEARAQAGAQPASGRNEGMAAAPAGSRAALGRLVARERDFLQGLATLIQDHARGFKEDLVRARAASPGTGSAGATAASMGAAAAAGSVVSRPAPSGPSYDATMASPPSSTPPMTAARPDSEPEPAPASALEPEPTTAWVAVAEDLEEERRSEDVVGSGPAAEADERDGEGVEAPPASLPTRSDRPDVEAEAADRPGAMTTAVTTAGAQTPSLAVAGPDEQAESAMRWRPEPAPDSMVRTSADETVVDISEDRAAPADAKPTVSGTPSPDARPPVDANPTADARPPVDAKPTADATPRADAAAPADAIPPPAPTLEARSTPEAAPTADQAGVGASAVGRPFGSETPEERPPLRWHSMQEGLPDPDDEGPQQERSVRELFWGED